METRPYIPPSIKPDINLEKLYEQLGLIKVNRRNYEILKQSRHERVYYDKQVDILIFGNHIVLVDEELADDVAAVYRSESLPKQPEEINLFISSNFVTPPPSLPLEMNYIYSLI